MSIHHNRLHNGARPRPRRGYVLLLPDVLARDHAALLRLARDYVLARADRRAALALELEQLVAAHGAAERETLAGAAAPGDRALVWLLQRGRRMGRGYEKLVEQLVVRHVEHEAATVAGNMGHDGGLLVGRRYLAALWRRGGLRRT